MPSYLEQGHFNHGWANLHPRAGQEANACFFPLRLLRSRAAVASHATKSCIMLAVHLACHSWQQVRRSRGQSQESGDLDLSWPRPGSVKFCTLAHNWIDKCPFSQTSATVAFIAKTKASNLFEGLLFQPAHGMMAPELPCELQRFSASCDASVHLLGRDGSTRNSQHSDTPSASTSKHTDGIAQKHAKPSPSMASDCAVEPLELALGLHGFLGPIGAAPVQVDCAPLNQVPKPTLPSSQLGLRDALSGHTLHGESQASSSAALDHPCLTGPPVRRPSRLHSNTQARESLPHIPSVAKKSCTQLQLPLAWG